MGLGYFVGCSLVSFFGINGFSVYVSSDANEYNCTEIEHCINGFIEERCRDFIAYDLTPKKFDEFRSSLILKKTTSDLNIMKEASKYWTEITKLDYCLDIHTREADEIQKVNY